MGLETNAAVLAAQRATENDILSMERSLEEMSEELETTDRIATESDAAFHMAVAFATKNPVLIHLMRNFYDFLFMGIKKNLTHMYQDGATLHDVLAHHRQVFAAIRDREPEKAGKAMQSHIHYVQEYFRSR